MKRFELDTQIKSSRCEEFIFVKVCVRIAKFKRRLAARVFSFLLELQNRMLAKSSGSKLLENVHFREKCGSFFNEMLRWLVFGGNLITRSKWWHSWWGAWHTVCFQSAATMFDVPFWRLAGWVGFHSLTHSPEHLSRPPTEKISNNKCVPHKLTPATLKNITKQTHITACGFWSMHALGPNVVTGLGPWRDWVLLKKTQKAG